MGIEDMTKRDPLTHLVGMGFPDRVTERSVEDYILNMEANGGHALAASEKLPTEGSLGDNERRLTEMGFTLGPPDEADPLFRSATFPAGWTRRVMGDPRGGEILDERGVVRITTFYKAAFYDRTASMSIVNVGYNLVSKFLYSSYDYEGGVYPKPVTFVAKDPDPIPWDLLTAEERADAIDQLRIVIVKGIPDYAGVGRRREYDRQIDVARAELDKLGEPSTVGSADCRHPLYDGYLDQACVLCGSKREPG